MTSAKRLGDLLEWAEAQFDAADLTYGHGTDNAFDEACVLLREAAGFAFDADLTQALWQSELPVEAVTGFKQFVTLRINTRKPAAILTGKAYVQGLTLFTNPAVIVPRSLVGELLFNGSLDSWLEVEPSRVLDLCTGSGAIAIQAALVFDQASVDGVDIEATAILLARRNLALHELDQRVSFFQGDLYAPVLGKRYDLILSNPPYVNATTMASLPPEYQSEPELALAGGVDGMDVVRRIMTGARAHLNPKGILLIEIGHEANFFERAFPELRFTYLSVTAGDDLIVLIAAQDLPT